MSRDAGAMNVYLNRCGKDDPLKGGFTAAPVNIYFPDS